MPVPVNPQPAEKIIAWSGQVNHHRHLADISLGFDGVKVPLKPLAWAVAQDLQLLHVGDVKPVVFLVNLVCNCGHIAIKPLE